MMSAPPTCPQGGVMPPRFTPLLLVLLLAPCALAGDHLPPPPPDEPPCAPPIEQNIAKRQVLLVPHETATTYPKLELREVEVGRMPGGPILDFVDQKQYVTVMELKECEVEQK